LTDDREKSAAELASRMFGRWSQENYFKYAGEHRDLDALVTQEMDQPTGRVSFPILSARSRKRSLPISVLSYARPTSSIAASRWAPNRPVARPMRSLLCKCRRSRPTSYGCRPSTARFRPACPERHR
jgi:hypothetical protein